MKILVDQNVPHAELFFGTLGEVTLLPGRELTHAHVKNADALIVRSVTQVNEALIGESQIRFVGTCTIGTDHLDINYLQSQQIPWASAQGCNANAVVEYVFAALAALKVDLKEAKIGIVGCGNVGGRLYRRLCRLGVAVKVYDPGLNDSQCEHLTSLREVLTSDVVCLHTPLTVNGPWPTWHMLGTEELNQMRPSAVLLNAGRGEVIDTAALLSFMHSHPQFKVVLDVWESEPNINIPLLKAVTVATPHIAGYSYDGKVAGTEMIYRALCAHIGCAATVDSTEILSMDKNNTLNWSGNRLPNDVGSYIRQCYDILADDKRMRSILTNTTKPASEFDLLRKNYPQRREFHNYFLPRPVSTELAEYLTLLGFRSMIDASSQVTTEDGS